MNLRRFYLVIALSGAALLASACQMRALSKPCFQEKGCEHHPING